MPKETLIWRAVRRTLAASLLLVAPLSFAAPAPDLATTEGFAATCKAQNRLKPAQLAGNDAKVAFVVCKDTALAKQVVAWGLAQFKAFRRLDEGDGFDGLLKEIRQELDYIIKEVGTTRQVLEKTELGAKKSLMLKPAAWSMDIDGDDTIEPWEQYFFAIPTRGLYSPRFAMPNNDPAYYDKNYVLDAQIRVDQSDVLWARAYHQFIEGVLLNVRALELKVNPKLDNIELVLARPALLKKAHALIASGIATSEQMRVSVLTETTDEHEWIGNPEQKSSVFPVPLDDRDFGIWREILEEWSALWSGSHLLPRTDSNERGVRGLIGELSPFTCPPNESLNIAKLYNNPLPAGTVLFSSRRSDNKALSGRQFAAKYCQPISEKNSITSLPEFFERAGENSAGMSFLRHLYWAN